MKSENQSTTVEIKEEENQSESLFDIYESFDLEIGSHQTVFRD